MNELYEFTESYIEFNGGSGGESLETDAMITDLNNDIVIQFFYFKYKKYILK